jgi:selenocysteine lyase/cysteine desulfurase
LVTGGSGGRSELLDHPRSLPSALEAGTPNGPGIAGLSAGLQHVTSVGLETISQQEKLLRQVFVTELRNGDRPLLREWPSSSGHTAVVSVQIPGLRSSEAAALLEERYQLLVRGGLHCAALAHQTLKTSDTGTVRVSFSHRNSIEEVRRAAEAVLELAHESE